MSHLSRQISPYGAYPRRPWHRYCPVDGAPRGIGTGAGMRELAVIGGPLRAVARCRNWTRPVMAIILGVAWLTAASVGAPASDAAPLSGPAGAPAAAPPTIGGCQIFPADNVWNTPIDTLPVHARSDAWI